MQNFIGCHRGFCCIKHWTVLPCSSLCDPWFHNLVLVNLYHLFPKLPPSLISSQFHLFSYAVIQSLWLLLSSFISLLYIFWSRERELTVSNLSVPWIYTDKGMFCFVHKCSLNNFQLCGFFDHCWTLSCYFQRHSEVSVFTISFPISNIKSPFGYIGSHFSFLM